VAAVYARRHIFRFYMVPPRIGGQILRYIAKKELARTNLNPRNELRREAPQLISGFMSQAAIDLKRYSAVTWTDPRPLALRLIN
jgi:hypothetical protein